MRRFLVLAFLLATTCSTWTVPVVPVPPGPGPVVPPDPVPFVVVPFALAQSVAPGEARADVVARLGAPAIETPQDDGTRLARWATTNEAGEPKWIDVQFDAAGRVLGHSFVPRVAPPEPATASLPDEEIDIECVGDACRIPGR